MKISTEKPAIYERLRAAFGIDWDSGVIITYGDTVHVKSGVLSPDLKVHEAVHIEQQAKAENLDSWVDRYISDAGFRFTQELEAYQAQTRFLRRTTRDRELLHRRINHIARSMAVMYGGMITYEGALKVI